MTRTGEADDRRRRNTRGLHAETLATGYLIVKGHRILARRFKTPAGEIDVITVRNRRVGFVEIKSRGTLADCEASITPRLRQRVRRASDLWLGQNPGFQAHDVGFDLVFVLPWRKPIWLRDAL